MTEIGQLNLRVEAKFSLEAAAITHLSQIDMMKILHSDNLIPTMTAFKTKWIIRSTDDIDNNYKTLPTLSKTVTTAIVTAINTTDKS